MIIKCTNCGTTSTYKVLSTCDLDDTIIRTTACACGRRTRKIHFVKVLEIERQDGKPVNEKVLDKSANL